MKKSKNPFEDLEPELEYCEPEFLEKINEFMYGNRDKTGILPLMNILSLGKICNDPHRRYLNFPNYEDPYNELFSHSNSSNRAVINFIQSFKEYITSAPKDTLYCQYSSELSTLCDETLQTLVVAEQASQNLDDIIEDYKEQKLIKRNKGTKPQQCLEDIIQNPRSSSLWGISKLLQELDHKEFGDFHKYIEYIGFEDTTQTYSYTTGDKQQDLDTIEFFNEVIDRYEDHLDYLNNESSSVFETIINVSEVVLENIGYEFQARTQRIEEEMDEQELEIDNANIGAELSQKFQWWQSKPTQIYNTRRK